MKRLAEALLSSRALTAIAKVPGGEIVVAMHRQGAFALTQRPLNHFAMFGSYDELLNIAIEQMHIDMQKHAEEAIWRNPYEPELVSDGSESETS